MGGGRFSDGFLLGLIIGGGLTLLFTTKKGNKILKVVSEEGLEGLNKFIEEASESVDEYVEKKEASPAEESVGFSDQDVGVEEKNGDAKTEEVKPHRRFFRRNK
ncbi:MAG: hypothetical protein UU21_C0005G0010 [Candidatus Levybacteria bacterium GW2011_GWA2_40_8]|nr:MAG: hypothetical protein UU21_C0005G0010 [Candidatus Levybacteria bacterium GW2011_GWA2_40_8]